MPRLNGKKLSGVQSAALNAAIRDAYIDHFNLQTMLTQRLNKRLNDFTAPNAPSYEVMVHQLLEQADAQSFTAELVKGALLSRPNNPELVAFAEQFGLVPTPDDEAAFERAGYSLERFIEPHLPDLDIAVFREHLGRVEGQIARVEVSTNRGSLKGTGFLLGPNVLITNFHVLEPVILTAENKSNDLFGKPEDVVVCFDYKAMQNGAVVNQGTVFRLDKDWLLDSSPYSKADLASNTTGALPADDEADYALVRLAAPAGTQKVGGSVADPGAPARGWLVPKIDAAADFRPDQPLFIVQHPEGRPLKLTLGFKAMLGPNANGTRVRYRTNTAAGSSGSPCFNEKFELLALHHSGDPVHQPLYVPTYNQGVPFAAILALLKARGKERFLQ